MHHILSYSLLSLFAHWLVMSPFISCTYHQVNYHDDVVLTNQNIWGSAYNRSITWSQLKWGYKVKGWQGIVQQFFFHEANKNEPAAKNTFLWSIVNQL